MNINLSFLEKELINTTVPIPISGTLSGHAAGEPFDKHVFRFIKNHFPDNTFRQYEYLNKLYLENQKVISYEQRQALIKYPAVAFLMNRGKDATQKWSKETPFSEKQNDTADIVVLNNNFFNLIDVKTFNSEKHGQPPNIISAYKLAEMCMLMLESKIFNSHDITYISISWIIDNNDLKCKKCSIKELFKTNPSNLYINWAAAMQVQFHVEDLDQTYSGNTKQWCTDYLRAFVMQAKNRADTMIEKFVKPFMNY